ncbi:MAG: hypothetical protein HC809_00490 [Gammaproteobacteria bacterium]|nr:hypothetical protein [Gammaproteobacteria bacterium]
MWKAWVGFNASHSMGAILFGALFIYLALAQPELLFTSAFLSVLGGLFLVGYTVLGRLYWFSVPYRGIIVASLLYIGAYVIKFAA